MSRKRASGNGLVLLGIGFGLKWILAKQIMTPRDLPMHSRRNGGKRSQSKSRVRGSAGNAKKRKRDERRKQQVRKLREDPEMVEEPCAKGDQNSNCPGLSWLGAGYLWPSGDVLESLPHGNCKFSIDESLHSHIQLLLGDLSQMRW